MPAIAKREGDGCVLLRSNTAGTFGATSSHYTPACCRVFPHEPTLTPALTVPLDLLRSDRKMAPCLKVQQAPRRLVGAVMREWQDMFSCSVDRSGRSARRIFLRRDLIGRQRSKVRLVCP